MKKIIVTVGSVTYAIKLKNMLSRKGIRSSLVKVEDNKGSGCIHGVELDAADFLAAVVIMKENGVNYSVYE